MVKPKNKKSPGLIRGPIDFRSAFASIIVDTKEDWDRSQSLGASEAFGCLRRGFFAKREPNAADIPEDEDIEWGYSERGNEIERKFAVPKLQSIFGADKCFLMGDEQKTFIKGRLSATPDGMIIDVHPDALQNYGIERCSSDIVPEIKSLDPRVNLGGKPKIKHVGQNIIQTGIYNDCTNYRPKNGFILYINCSNYKDINAFATTFDPDTYKRAHERADFVFDINTTAAKCKPEGKLTGECKNCPFQRRCAEVEMSRYPEHATPVSEMSPDIAAKIEAKARTVKKLRDKHKELETEKKKEESDLREMMFDNDTNRTGGVGWVVNLIPMPGKESMDKEAMRADGLDPDKYKKTGNGYYTMRVDVKG